MQRFRLKLISLAVITLLITGCGTGTAARNLKTYPTPVKPELGVKKNGDVVTMTIDDFSGLTNYVISLSGQLEKCNNQASTWNE